MSLFKKFKPGAVSVQGDALVKRDEAGSVVAKAAPLAGSVVKNFRSQLRQVTNGGLDQLATLHAISQGLPWRAQLPDGQHTDWIVPTTAERMAASQLLWEYMHGKAVAQTEVLKAEHEAEDVAQYRALSDEQLAEAARPYLERVKKKGEDE